MDENYEEKYHQLEKKQWWFRARRNAVIDILENIDRNAIILDVGCSSGILLQELKEKGFKNLYGIDVSKKAIETSKRSGFTNSFVMNGENPDFEPQTFDIIISSDSLEHMELDQKALNNWHRLLKPKGKIIVFVPAFMSLWSAHDEINHHFRRYTRTELKSKIRKAGYSIKKSGYWNFTLFFPVYVFRYLKKLIKNDKPKDDLKQLPNSLNRILYTLMKAENKIFKHIAFPIGVSTYCVAMKSEKEVHDSN